MVLSTLLNAASSPTSKTPNRQLSYKERIQVHTLSQLVHFSPTSITRQTGIPQRAVNRCLAAGSSTPIKRSGRPRILTTPSRRRLIDHATNDRIQRRKPWEQIADELGFELCSRTIKTAFDREHYFRRVAAAKPLISENNKIKRIVFAEPGVSGPDFEWNRFI